MKSIDHTSHIIPLRIYLSVAGALMVLTVLTVLVSTFELGFWNIAIAIGIAILKGTLVILFFMHVLYANKLYAVVFLTALIFLAIFIMLTMLDTQNRGLVNSESEKPIKAYSVLYNEDGSIKVDYVAERLKSFRAEHGVGPITELMVIDSLDVTLAESGKAVFSAKCISCHMIGETHAASQLTDVTIRRSPEFVMNTILNHKEMAEQIAKQNNLPTKNLSDSSTQNIKETEARAILEYLRMIAPESDAIEAEEEEWIVE